SGDVAAYRMSPVSASNGVLLGCALCTIDVQSRRGLRPAQILAICVLLIGLLGFLCTAYGVESLYGLAAYTRTASSLLFIVLSCGVLFARPDRGVMNVIVSDTAGGVVARRLLPI